jgi:spermidine/putrescine transport system substrate-binding protein
MRTPIIVIGILLGIALAMSPSCADVKDELVVLNWPSYLDPALIERFQRKYEVNLRIVLYEGDDQRDEMLVASEGAGYDVVLVSGNMLQFYARRGWLEPMTEKQVPNLRHVAGRWRTAFKGADGFAAPYTWGTLGIGYREDLVPDPIESWAQLFQPVPQLQGRIAMLRHNRDLVGMALKARGYSVNSTAPAELDSALELLLEQKPHVRTYGYVALTPDSAMVSGDIIAAMMFNGDAVMLQEHEPRIRFLVPSEGGNLWVDYFVVMSRSSRKDLAFALIDFLNKPENAAQAAQYVHFATTNDAAKELLPEEYFSNPVIYPTQEVIERSEFYTPLPPRVMGHYNSIAASIIY